MCHQMDVLPQVLSGGGNVGHVFVQNVLLGADTVILDVLWPVQLANVKVEGLKDHEDEFSTVSSTDSQYARVIGSAGCVYVDVPSCRRRSADSSACSCFLSSTPSPDCWNTPADRWLCADGWKYASFWMNRSHRHTQHLYDNYTTFFYRFYFYYIMY